MTSPSNHPLDPDKPYFLIPADDPYVISMKEQLSLLDDKEMHTMNIDVPPEAVDEGDVSFPGYLVATIQHFPQLIEKYLFSLEFRFPQIAESELYFPEDEWKTDEKYYRWFHRMYEYPATYFFIQDRDARFYFLFGDKLADGKLKSERVKGKEASRIAMDVDQMQELGGRLFEACRLFKLYCHGSGFNPDPYLEAALAELNFTGTNLFEQVQKQYAEDVAQGLRVTLRFYDEPPNEE